MPPIARLVPAAAAVVVLLAAGCGDNTGEPPVAAPPDPGASTGAPSPSPSASPSAAARQPHILVVTATGTARVTSLTYVLDGESTKVSVSKLPWRISIDVPADGLPHTWEVTVQHGKGRVEVRAIFNGKVVGTARGSTSNMGTASTGGSLLG